MFFFVNSKISLNKIGYKSSGLPYQKTLKNSNPNFLRKTLNFKLNLKGLEFPDSNTKKSIRLNSDENIQKVLFYLQKISDEKTFFNFCLTNREHLSYCLLYRLSALKLKAESEVKNDSQTKNIKNFRKKILENILFIDQPVSQALILSEKRIKEILENPLKEEFILKKIGEDALSVTCFWIVLYAALLAWKKKDESENFQIKVETYEKLKKIHEIFSGSQKHRFLLAQELLFLEKYFDAKTNSWTQSQKNQKDLIEGLKILISQLEKLPSNSYGILLQSTVEICNQILKNEFGSKIENLDNFKIFFPLNSIQNDSKLI